MGMLSLLPQSARLHNCAINLYSSDHQDFPHQDEHKHLFPDVVVVSKMCTYWD